MITRDRTKAVDALGHAYGLVEALVDHKNMALFDSAQRSPLTAFGQLHQAAMANRIIDDTTARQLAQLLDAVDPDDFGDDQLLTAAERGVWLAAYYRGKRAVKNGPTS